MSVTLLTCTKCGMTLPADHFSTTRRGRDTYDSIIPSRTPTMTARLAVPTICDPCHARARECEDKRRRAAAWLWFTTLTLTLPDQLVTIGADDTGQPVTLDRATRNKHLYLIGKSRTGKTTLMLNLMRADLEHGDGFTFIDPAGDAALEVLGYVPAARRNDVFFFDPTRDDCPALNLLALPYPAHKLAADIVAVFRLFFDSWGPRMNMLLLNGLLALLDDRRHEPHSLADLKRLFTRDDYRSLIAERADNDELREFLTDDLPRFERSALDPVLNKLSAFLIPLSPLSRLFSATTNGVDFPTLLNSRGVFVCSLSKGKIGEEPAKFLGGLIVAALTMAALARADQPPSTRVDHFLYVDEFQNFAVDSFATIFAEAAKYRLNLCVAHQTRDQLTPEIRAALGNASTYVVFRISHPDAATLAPELGSRRMKPLSEQTRRELVTAARSHAEKTTLARACRDIIADPDQAARRYDDVAPNTQVLWWVFLEKAAPDLDRLLRNHIRELTYPTPTERPQPWPTAADIVNLENLHAFARIERPENTTALTVPFPPPPDEQNREAVFAAQHERHRTHQSPDDPRNAPKTSQTMHRNTPAPTKPPRDPDDFTF